MIRLFVAIDLPHEIKDELLNIKMGIPSANWKQREQIHLTLRFIGEVQEPFFREIGTTLSQIKMSPFTLRMQAVGCFHSQRSPRILWVGVSKSDELQSLHRKIDKTLQSLGLPAEGKKFFPHVTLARFSNPNRCNHNGHSFNNFFRISDFLQHFSLYKSTPFSVNCFHLYSSNLTPKRAIYQIEQSYPLQ